MRADLDDKFFSWHQDQSRARFELLLSQFHELVQYGKGISSCLSSSRFWQSQHIKAFQYSWYALSLDFCWNTKSTALRCLNQNGIQSQIWKRHSLALIESGAVGHFTLIPRCCSKLEVPLSCARLAVRKWSLVYLFLAAGNWVMSGSDTGRR